MTRIARLVVAVLFVVAGAIAAYIFGPGGAVMTGFKELNQAVPVVVVGTTAVAMLVGIFASAMWDQLKNAPGDVIDIRLILGRALQSASLIRASLVSPIVFAAVYAVIKEQPDVVVAHLLAFQNGFFWKSVLSTRRP
jgi:hypothetical protein